MVAEKGYEWPWWYSTGPGRVLQNMDPVVMECTSPLPESITAALQQARLWAGEARLGVVLCGDVVVVDLHDWRAWYGPLGQEGKGKNE